MFFENILNRIKYLTHIEQEKLNGDCVNDIVIKWLFIKRINFILENTNKTLIENKNPFNIKGL